MEVFIRMALSENGLHVNVQGVQWFLYPTRMRSKNKKNKKNKKNNKCFLFLKNKNRLLIKNNFFLNNNNNLLIGGTHFFGWTPWTGISGGFL